MKILNFKLLALFVLFISLTGCNNDDYDDDILQSKPVKVKQEISVDKNKIDFGTVKSIIGKKEVVITVTNKSKVTISGFKAKVDHDSFQGIVSVKAESTIILPSKSIKIFVTYKAIKAKAGNYKGALIRLTSPKNEFIKIPLIVKVIKNEESILSLDKNKIDFGDVIAKTGKKEVIIKVTNRSNEAVVGFIPELKATSFQGVVKIRAEKSIIAPGKSIKLFVTYKAENAKPGKYKGGTITLSTLIDDKTIIIPLTVNVIKNNTDLINSLIILDKYTIDFGNIKTKTGEKNVVITVTNKSDKTMEGFKTKTVFTSFQGSVTITVNNSKLASGKSMKVHVTYKASNAQPGNYKGGKIIFTPSIGSPIEVPISVTVIK
jgi:hypothetical protein